ncbi:NgoPII family restriction endonuclease [Candidatus Woesearchaeota archaeon]|nr:NgoPII family restriction endonuclease [Candidatus Woesearchaeota archaeon]
MSANVLTAIHSIASFKNNNLKSYASTYLNRINAVGGPLENYIKDAFANSFKITGQNKKLLHSKEFSWLGNQNHPPDLILKGSDAFEIKKIEGFKNALALNSSPPKNKLRVNDTRLTKDCRKCDGGNWKEKDIFYIVGNAKKGVIKYLLFVHGECYAADHEVYEKIYLPIKDEVDSVLTSLNLEKGKTKEIGKVKKVDPLGITELRIRGMWTIKNPLEVFKGVFEIEEKEAFNLLAIMRKDKYDKFPKNDINRLESDKKVIIKDVKICNPNNPAELMEAKVIICKIK